MPDDLAYHYTSVQALFEIVRSRRFRLSNVLFMNDYMEVEWLWQIVREEMKRREEAVGLKKPDSDYLSHLRGQVNRVVRAHVADTGLEFIFCGCFSRLDDDLSQWRGYADDGRGVAIGVNTIQVVTSHRRDPDTSFYPLEEANVIYDTAEQTQLVKSQIDSYLTDARMADEKAERQDATWIIGSVAIRVHNELARLAAVCKNPAFDHEEEVRLVIRPSAGPQETGFYDESFFKGFPYGVEFWHRNGRIVPYADIYFPAEAIRSIRLGPKFGGEMEKGALQLFLSKNQVAEHVVRQVGRSEASYR